MALPSKTSSCFQGIQALLPRGSGALVVHRALEQVMPSYHVDSYPAQLEYVPPAVRFVASRAGDLVHAPPDHAIFACPRRTPAGSDVPQLCAGCRHAPL